MVADHVGIATLPSFSAAQDHPGDLGRLATRALKLLILLGIPLTVGGFLLATPLVTFISGAPYAAAGPAFAVLALSICLHFATKPSVNLLAVKSAPKLTVLFFCLFSLNVAANFFAIPLWGLMGAAVVSSLCEVVFFAWALWLTRHYFRFSGFGFSRSLLAGVLASAVMGLGIHESPGLYWLVLGPLVYGLVLLGAGGLNRDDLTNLKSVLRMKA